MNTKPSYASALKVHLSDYKKTVLKINEDGVWTPNKKPYSHILPKVAKDQNILPDISSEFWAYAAHKALTPKLHRDFHHLSSSQALTFNIFFPFFELEWAPLSVLLSAFGLPNKSSTYCEFESIPTPQEGTTFDAAITFDNKTRLLVEVKLSETGFGKCADDVEHHEKRKNTYLASLHGKVSPESLRPATFFANYQLLRNVSHLNTGDSLVLLVPRANKRTFEQAETFISTALMPDTRNSVKLVAVEDLISTLKDLSPNTRLAAYASCLAAKYVLSSAR